MNKQPPPEAQAQSRTLKDHYDAFIARHGIKEELPPAVDHEVMSSLLEISRSPQVTIGECKECAMKVSTITYKKIRISKAYEMVARALGYKSWAGARFSTNATLTNGKTNLAAVIHNKNPNQGSLSYTSDMFMRERPKHSKEFFRHQPGLLNKLMRELERANIDLSTGNEGGALYGPKEWKQRLIAFLETPTAHRLHDGNKFHQTALFGLLTLKHRHLVSGNTFHKYTRHLPDEFVRAIGE